MLVFGATEGPSVSKYIPGASRSALVGGAIRPFRTVKTAQKAFFLRSDESVGGRALLGLGQ
jgi:hypothetical protein